MTIMLRLLGFLWPQLQPDLFVFFFFCNTNYHDKYFNYDCNLKHLKLTWQSVNMLHQPKNDMAKLIFQEDLNYLIMMLQLKLRN